MTHQRAVKLIVGALALLGCAKELFFQEEVATKKGFFTSGGDIKEMLSLPMRFFQLREGTGSSSDRRLLAFSLLANDDDEPNGARVLTLALGKVHGKAKKSVAIRKVRQHGESFPIHNDGEEPGETAPYCGCSEYDIAETSSYVTGDTINLIETMTEGEECSKSWKLFFSHASLGEVVSPWHDIPYRMDDEVYYIIVEIPKLTKAKMECMTKEAYNPIAQDTNDDGSLRDYHGPIYWNYGYIPQTWEDPNYIHSELKVSGDNDPIDVVALGESLPMGSIVPVKVLGALAMIDSGEVDWKVLVVPIDDALAAEYNDIHDVPDADKSGIREWFRWYKFPDGIMNEFGYDEEWLNHTFTKDVIAETHEHWQALVHGEVDPDGLWIGDES